MGRMPDEVTIRPVGFEAMPLIGAINRALFNEERVINRFDRPDLVMLVAYVGDEAAGFKIGYGLEDDLYYSAKGGVADSFRRRGIAGALLDGLMEEAGRRGYETFCFDTFPNQHVGMTVLALSRDFVVAEVRHSDIYDDLRVRFSTRLNRSR